MEITNSDTLSDTNRNCKSAAVACTTDSRCHMGALVTIPNVKAHARFSTKLASRNLSSEAFWHHKRRFHGVFVHPAIQDGKTRIQPNVILCFRAVGGKSKYIMMRTTRHKATLRCTRCIALAKYPLTASVSGPIGWPAPSSIDLSMSSTDPSPRSSISIPCASPGTRSLVNTNASAGALSTWASISR